MGQPWQSAPQPWQPEQQSYVNPPPPPQEPSILRRWWFWAAVAGLVVVIFSAGGVGYALGRSADESPQAEAATEDAETRLQAAYEGCRGRDTDDTLELADAGATILINTRSEYGSPAGMDCVLNAIGITASIEAQIGRTTSLMGVQEATHDDLELSWSYHPDNGVDMVITDTLAAD